MLGMEQFGQIGANVFPDVTGAVEFSLLGNAKDFDLVAKVERMALDNGGILHWGQSCGLMSASDVQERFSALEDWKHWQSLLGGATFTNLFMQDRGLA